MEHLLARTLATGSPPHQQGLHLIKEMVLDMAFTFLAVSTGASQCHQLIHVGCTTSLWKTGTLPFNWDVILMMDTCYSLPTKDLFHEDKEALILLFQTFEVALLPLPAVLNVLNTYNCDFVRGDVPAGQSLPLLGHTDSCQGMVLSHQLCQDREVLILILVMVGHAMLSHFAAHRPHCKPQVRATRHDAAWHEMAPSPATLCREEYAAIILQQGEGIGDGATSIMGTAGQEGGHRDTHIGSCRVGICPQLSLAAVPLPPGHWLSLAEAFAEWQLWCQDAAVCGVCERLPQKWRLELTGLGSAAGVPWAGLCPGGCSTACLPLAPKSHCGTGVSPGSCSSLG